MLSADDRKKIIRQKKTAKEKITFEKDINFPSISSFSFLRFFFIFIFFFFVFWERLSVFAYQPFDYARHHFCTFIQINGIHRFVCFSDKSHSAFLLNSFPRLIARSREIPWQTTHTHTIHIRTEPTVRGLLDSGYTHTQTPAQEGGHGTFICGCRWSHWEFSTFPMGLPK